MMRQSYLLFALAGIACCVGFALGKASRPSGDPIDSPSRERNLDTRVSAIVPSELPGDIATDAGRISSITDGGALRELWETFGNDARGQIGRQLVLERWAEVDPDGAFEYFESDSRRLQKFLVEWALLEPAVAEFDARIDQLSIPTVERFSAEYFKMDVEATTAWLKTVPRGLAYDRAHYGIYLASREGGGEALLELARELEKTK